MFRRFAMVTNILVFALWIGVLMPVANRRIKGWPSNWSLCFPRWWVRHSSMAEPQTWREFVDYLF